MSQNHCSEISGSMRWPDRCECGTSCTNGCVPEMSPSLRSAATTALRASSTCRPSNALARGRGHARVLADHGDLVEPVRAADLEVVRVVAGGDLERAGAELGVDVVVGDDRQPPSDERQDRVLPDQPGVALVVGVDRDRGVGEDRLRPDGRDRERPRAALERVVDLVERVLDRALLDLEVRDRRAQPRVPVDHVGVAVDVALLVQRHEHVHHRAHVLLVHREALVARSRARRRGGGTARRSCRRTARATPRRAR